MSDEIKATQEVTSVDEPAKLAFMTEKEAQPSSILHVSVRAWLALMLCGTVCYMAIMGIEVKEPLYTLAIAAASFYLGQKGLKP